jgi:hypothetical protein
MTDGPGRSFWSRLRENGVHKNNGVELSCPDFVAEERKKKGTATLWSPSPSFAIVTVRIAMS